MTGGKFEGLVQIMARLRGPEGCPWDREQDFRSLKPMLVEEVYEVLEAIDAEDYRGLAEELGDLLLHVVFHARMGEELGHFAIDDVIDGISEKLIRRHPHVFGDGEANSAREVVDNWEAIKKQEKTKGGDGKPPALLDGIPSQLPALHEAHKISSRVARVGFEWPEIDAVFEKLQEEIQELRDEISRKDSEIRLEAIESELGDTFFTLVNIARFLEMDSESALKSANRKFRSRFEYVEQALLRAGKPSSEWSLEEMESLWQQAKKKGK
jgi:MazG family protein